MSRLHRFFVAGNLKWQPILLFGLVVGLALLSGARPAQADSVTITVDRYDDDNSAEAQGCSESYIDCSLRGAISLANGDPYNTYTIMLPAGTYTLNLANGEGTEDDNYTGDLDIKTSMTIQGTNATAVSIETANGIADRVIHIFQPGTSGVGNAGNMTVDITGVSIQGGSTNQLGGGILNETATLNLTGSNLTGNNSVQQGGGIANIEGILHVVDSLFDNNASTDGNDAISSSTECGGAIYNGPTSIATVDNALFSSNSAPWGGGGICVNDGAGTALTVADSTFSGNTANGYLTSGGDTAGGAIYSNGIGADGTILVERSTFNGNQSATGGAIRSNSLTFNIINSTFYENSAQNGGAVVVRTGTMTITNSTFAHNAASVEGDSWNREVTGALNVYNSIMQGMGVGTNCFGGLADESGNVNWNGAGCPGLTTDPVLQPPADNGSSTTQTMALGTGSGALEKATVAQCPATDQRGVDRPQP
ncbi:MAG TPA: choice-of-anchor Q domain-containing protein, partial [Promineifilum sp.]|nr:choice-of-anchor Q domain-containing protein [Promineifilum sp.]